jgi:hypothetical protein
MIEPATFRDKTASPIRILTLAHPVPDQYPHMDSCSINGLRQVLARLTVISYHWAPDFSFASEIMCQGNLRNPGLLGTVSSEASTARRHQWRTN